MSVCSLAYLKKHVQTSRNFLYMLTVVVARLSYDDNVVSYIISGLLMTSIIGLAKATPVARMLEVTQQDGTVDEV